MKASLISSVFVVGALMAQPLLAFAELPTVAAPMPAPRVRESLELKVESVGKKPLGTLRRGDTFTLRVVAVNGLAYGLTKLDLQVSANGAKLTSPVKKVFRKVAANDGTVRWLISGRLKDDKAQLTIAGESKTEDIDVSAGANTTVDLGGRFSDAK